MQALSTHCGKVSRDQTVSEGRMHLQSVGQVHAERRLQQRHVFHQRVTPGFELSLSHALQYRTHRNITNGGGAHLR